MQEIDYNARENKLAVFTAWLDGKEWQYQDTTRQGWVNGSEVCPRYNSGYIYRVKQTPKRVPLEAKDIPPGSVFRGAGEVKYDGWCAITSCSETGIRYWRHCDPLIGEGFQREITWAELMENDAQVKRPGEDWVECSKEISE